MKNVLLSLSSTLVLPAVLLLSSPLARAEVRPDAPVVAIAAPTTLAAVSERSGLGTLQPAAAPPEQRRAEAAAAADDPEPGWRERLALLGAAFLALLFILRRQLTHRLGDSSGRGRSSLQRRVAPSRREPTAEPTPFTGFTLSAFNNLPDTPPPEAAAGKPTNGTPLRAKPPRHPLQRKLPVVRRKARWPARLRPPEA